MQTLFVLYELSKTEYWKYENIPKNWQWIGSGHTMPFTIDNGQIKQEKSLYPQEEQFSGLEENLEEMRNYINNYFSDLLKRQVVKRFVIQNNAVPPVQ